MHFLFINVAFRRTKNTEHMVEQSSLNLSCSGWTPDRVFFFSAEGKKGDWDRDVPGSSGGRQS